MTTTTIMPAPVRKSVTVDATIETAFAVFTTGFGRWWPKSHSIGAAEQKAAVIEPKVGGRWYEVAVDGSECDWGEVLAWEPPTRVLLAWRLNAQWQYDPALHTEVDVRFEALGDGTTRVSLEHRLLENMGEAAEKARASLASDGGWGGLLDIFAAEAAHTVAG